MQRPGREREYGRFWKTREAQAYWRVQGREQWDMTRLKRGRNQVLQSLE